MAGGAVLSGGPSAGMGRSGGWRRWLPLLAALLAILATARLGWWQLERAQQKLDLQASIDTRSGLPLLPQADLPRTEAEAAAQQHRPTLLQGRWLAEHTLYLDNRQMNARQGFIVVTPLLLAPGDAVLVQRGWMPRDFADRSRLQALPAQPGQVRVAGRLAPPPSKLLALDSAEHGLIRQNLGLPALSREIGVALRPLSVQQTTPTQAGDVDVDAHPQIALPADGLLRQWPAVAVGVGKHHGYAFQWFALSALLVGLTLWFQVIQPRWRRQPRGTERTRPTE